MDAISQKQMDKWSEPYRNWHYYPDFVIPPNPDDNMETTSVDCPLVWKHRDEWKMFYTGFNGKGYQTGLANSNDLIHWDFTGKVMGFGKPGTYDHGGVTFGGMLFESYDVDAPRIPAKFQNRYWILYGCYPRQGGYELRPGAEGVAWSDDLDTWHRVSEDNPILSVDGAAEWEKDCIYQPWLVKHDERFWNFYNAANGRAEQMGLATSSDLLKWQRYSDNPIVRNGKAGSYDQQFCSDGKVFRDDDHWIMIYFGVGRGGAHIMVAFSYDLLNWTQHPIPLYKAGGHPTGLDETYAHKVSLVYHQETETYYMYYCAVGNKGRGIGLLTSKPVN